MNGPTPLATLAEYQDGSIVSRVVIKKEKGNVTVFAFDAEQALSEHTVPHEALVQVLEGQATITVGGTPHTVTAGNAIVMPGNVPHAVAADGRFKMMLVILRD